ATHDGGPTGDRALAQHDAGQRWFARRPLAGLASAVDALAIAALPTQLPALRASVVAAIATLDREAPTVELAHLRARAVGIAGGHAAILPERACARAATLARASTVVGRGGHAHPVAQRARALLTASVRAVDPLIDPRAAAAVAEAAFSERRALGRLAAVEVRQG